MSCCHGNDTKTREGEKITNSKCKIKRQLLTGVTLKTKRPLTPKDIADLEYARLEALVPSGRILGRICIAETNAHTTAEADRVIESMRAEVVGRNDTNHGIDLYIMSNPRLAKIISTQVYGAYCGVIHGEELHN